MSDDFSGVRITFDKASYVTGDTIKATISGKDVVTNQRTLTLSVVVTDPSDGATGTVNATVPLTEVHQDSVVVVSATDDLLHSWALSPDKLSVSTVA